jgi:hypothetical protein
MNKADKTGLTPIFWYELIKPNIILTNCELSENDKHHLTKLINCHSNIQNKMLTNTEKLNLGVDLLSTPNLFDKMNIGFMISFTDEMIENLELSQDIEHSIIGFLDKFKNTTLYFETKIKLIQLLSTTNTILKPMHIIALFLWSFSPDVYKNVYNILNNNSDNNLIWETYIYTLYSSLVHLPNYSGEVYRAINTKFNPNTYPLKGQISWKSFSTTSTDWKYTTPLITDKKGIIFIIQSKTGKNISIYSKYPMHNEVVFLPNTKFIVENYYKANVCCLGQSNIRLSTYSCSQTDIDKAFSGTTCIIIELIEI